MINKTLRLIKGIISEEKIPDKHKIKVIDIVIENHLIEEFFLKEMNRFKGKK